jgi:hypothetical protein
MRTADVDLIEMTDATIAGGDRNIFKLDVHVVFSFEKLTAVDLTGGDLEGNDMALQRRC